MYLEDYHRYMAYELETKVIWGLGETKAKAFAQGIQYAKGDDVESLVTIEYSQKLWDKVCEKGGGFVKWRINSNDKAVLSEEN